MDIQTTERKHFLPSRLIHKHNNWLFHFIGSYLNKIINKLIPPLKIIFSFFPAPPLVPGN